MCSGCTDEIHAPTCMRCVQCTQRAREPRDLLSARSLRTIASCAPVHAFRGRVELLAGSPRPVRAVPCRPRIPSRGLSTESTREWGRKWLAQIVLPEATLPNRREPRPATSSRMIWRPTVGASSTMSARSFSVESLPDTPASRPASSPGRAPATGRRSSGRRRVEVSGGVRPPPACAGIGTGQIFVARPGVSVSLSPQITTATVALACRPARGRVFAQPCRIASPHGRQSRPSRPASG